MNNIYPYFLSNLGMTRLDQVSCADICTMRLAHGLVFLVAIMASELSIMLNKRFGLEAMNTNKIRKNFVFFDDG